MEAVSVSVYHGKYLIVSWWSCREIQVNAWRSGRWAYNSLSWEFVGIIDFIDGQLLWNQYSSRRNSSRELSTEGEKWFVLCFLSGPWSRKYSLEQVSCFSSIPDSTVFRCFWRIILHWRGLPFLGFYIRIKLFWVLMVMAEDNKSCLWFEKLGGLIGAFNNFLPCNLFGLF